MLPRKVRISAAPLGPRTEQLRGVWQVGGRAQIFERGAARRGDRCRWERVLKGDGGVGELRISGTRQRHCMGAVDSCFSRSCVGVDEPQIFRKALRAE